MEGVLPILVFLFSSGRSTYSVVLFVLLMLDLKLMSCFILTVSFQFDYSSLKMWKGAPLLFLLHMFNWR